MIYQPSIQSSLKQFCLLQCLLLQSDEGLRIGFEFSKHSLCSGDGMISLEDDFTVNIREVLSHSISNSMMRWSSSCVILLGSPFGRS